MEVIDELTLLARQNDWEKIRLRIAAEPVIAKSIYTYKRNVLTELSYFGDIETIELLLTHGADSNAIDEMERTPLLGALEGAREGYDTLAVINRLLDVGADPNTMGHCGQSSIHIATRFRLANYMIVLLDRGANPYKKSLDMQPEDAFEIARSTRSRIIIDTLIEWEKSAISRCTPTEV